jgi:hypothetical protein
MRVCIFEMVEGDPIGDSIVGTGFSVAKGIVRRIFAAKRGHTPIRGM